MSLPIFEEEMIQDIETVEDIDVDVRTLYEGTVDDLDITDAMLYEDEVPYAPLPSPVLSSKAPDQRRFKPVWGLGGIAFVGLVVALFAVVGGIQQGEMFQRQ